MTASDAFADAVAAAILRLLTDDPTAARKLRAAMLAVPPTNGNASCTKRECAAALRIHPTTLDRAVRDGCPVEHVGAVRRFDVAKVRAWFDARGKKPALAGRDDIDITQAAERLNLRPRRKSA